MPLLGNSKRSVGASKEPLPTAVSKLTSQDKNGIIKERVDELLEPARPSSPKCCSCDRPADWITSCCSLMLCSYCMPDKFHQKHKRGHSRELCRTQGAIGLLNPRSPLEEETRYLMKNDMLCKREIILQVEDEESG
uniref:Uncharacterized protein n=1 Tax=Oryza glumipatula TaxID=40148 RepID=A0A0D9YZC5_9ORYZ